MTKLTLVQHHVLNEQQLKQAVIVILQQEINHMAKHSSLMQARPKIWNPNHFQSLNNIQFKVEIAFKTVQKKIESFNTSVAVQRKMLMHLKRIKKEVRLKTKGETFRLKKQYFEQFFFRLEKPQVCYAAAHEGAAIILYKPSNFKHFCNSLDSGLFFKRWKKLIELRSFEKLEFCPPPLSPHKRSYNLYQGMEIEKKSHNNGSNVNSQRYHFFLKHLRILVNHDEQSYQFMLNVLTHLFKRPGEALNVIMLFYSEKQGVGKNAFFETLVGLTMLGKSLCLQAQNAETLFGRFNQNYNKLLVIVDEMTRKTFDKYASKLKNVATSKYISFEQKFQDRIQILNLARYFIFTNEKCSVRIEKNDRRYVAFESDCSKACDQEHFNQFHKLINDQKAVLEFYEYLMSRDITNFVPERDRPRTRLYHSLQDERFSFKAFLKYVSNQEMTSLADLVLGKWYQKAANQWYQEYVFFCEDEKLQPVSLTKFGQYISQCGHFFLKRKIKGRVCYEIKDHDLLRSFVADI